MVVLAKMKQPVGGITDPQVKLVPLAEEQSESTELVSCPSGCSWCFQPGGNAMP